jgi:hypothetical protein
MTCEIHTSEYIMEMILSGKECLCHEEITFGRWIVRLEKGQEYYESGTINNAFMVERNTNLGCGVCHHWKENSK